MALLYGLAALIAVWWVAKFFAGSNPAKLAAMLKKLGGGAALAVAALLFMRGRLDMAMLVGGVGAWMLGWAYSHPFSQWTSNWRKPAEGLASGKTSRVASRTITMELDHESGDMRGVVMEGAFKGRALESLSPAELQGLMVEAQSSDPDGARLLQAYLDRRFPGGRKDAEADRDPGPNRPGQPGAMSKQEAYDILGLQPGAGEEAVRQAHRALIKRLHPDAGGTSALAARVNEAKDVLLK